MATFTSSTFLGGAGRFDSQDNGGTWSGARDATSSDANYATYEIEAEKSGVNYRVQRVFLPIDTSTIPATATITGVTLNFNGNYEGGATGTFAHLIKSTQATTGSRNNADFNNVEFTTGGNVAISDAVSTAKSITGNATSLTWIVKEGTTLLSLITGDDLNNTTPVGTDEWATVTAPELVVTYTLPSSGFMNFF